MRPLTAAAARPGDSYPRLMHHTFLSFRPQPRGVPNHRFIRHRSVTGSFQTSPSKRRLAALTPPNQVRYPTDRQFASGCSPPRLATDAVTFSYGVVGSLRHG